MASLADVKEAVRQIEKDHKKFSQLSSFYQKALLDHDAANCSGDLAKQVKKAIATS